MLNIQSFYLKLTLISCFLYFLPNCGLFSQRNEDWLSHNDRGNRYEGTYTRKVSNPSIDLISLTGHFEPFEFGKNQILNVRFYSPREDRFQIKAEELTVSQFYWMQGKETKANQGWNQFSQWPVDYFLKRLGILHRNLGVLVQYTGTETRYFLPALVFHSEAPSEITRYVLQFRLGRAIASGSFKIYKGETRNKANLLQEGKISAKSGGTAFPVAVPAQVLQDYQGWVLVEIHLLERATLDPFSYSLHFYHTTEH